MFAVLKQGIGEIGSRACSKKAEVCTTEASMKSMWNMKPERNRKYRPISPKVWKVDSLQVQFLYLLRLISKSDWVAKVGEWFSPCMCSGSSILQVYRFDSGDRK